MAETVAEDVKEGAAREPAPEPTGHAVRAGGGSEIDVEALVAEIREEAQRLRSRDESAGFGEAVPRSLPSVVDTSAVERLLELADPRAVELRSHRRRLAPLALGVKRVLRRLLTPVFDRQTAFNRRLALWLGEIETDVDERIAGLARRLALLESTLPPLSESEGLSPVDVERLEAELRGRSPAEERRRHLALFADPASGPVFEIGCGRGDFLAMLREAGVPAHWFDRDPALVDEARSRGLDARLGDPVDALAGYDEASLGGVVCFRHFERLPLAKTVRALSAAHEKLRPGGVLLVEARNLASLIVHLRSWALDPTLRQPLHPLTLRFLVEEVGFASHEIVYTGEVESDLVLEGAGDGDSAARNAARLNALLFAPQEYAVVARR